MERRWLAGKRGFDQGQTEERGLPDAGPGRGGAAPHDRELCSAQPPWGKGSVAHPRNVIYITTTPRSKRGCGLETEDKSLTQRCRQSPERQSYGGRRDVPRSFIKRPLPEGLRGARPSSRL